MYRRTDDKSSQSCHSIVLFINRGGCCGGCSFGVRIIEKDFFAWKLTSQSAAQSWILIRSALTKFAEVCGDSTIMYRLVSSANYLIEQPISMTMSHHFRN